MVVRIRFTMHEYCTTRFDSDTEQSQKEQGFEAGIALDAALPIGGNSTIMNRQWLTTLAKSQCNIVTKDIPLPMTILATRNISS